MKNETKNQTKKKGRKAFNPNENLTFKGYHLYKVHDKKLKKIAKEEGRSESGMVRHLISSYGKKLEVVSEGGERVVKITS